MIFPEGRDQLPFALDHLIQEDLNKLLFLDCAFLFLVICHKNFLRKIENIINFSLKIFKDLFDFIKTLVSLYSP